MENNIQTDKCVSCGNDTQIPVDKNIEFRLHYVEGAGQLCSECFISVYKKIHKNDNDKTKS